jgi:sulfatase modifying factor 1
MKHNSTGITRKIPGRNLPVNTSPDKKGNSFYFWLACAGILGLLGALTYVLWPMPKRPFGDQADPTPPKINANTPPGPAPAGMVWIPGGEFWMGGEVETYDGNVAPDSLPMHKVYVDGFWMDQHEVSNEKWARFAKETGYLTVAELKPDPRDSPMASEEELKYPCSIVFTPPKKSIDNLEKAQQFHLWWSMVRGASWKNPEGKDSTIVGKDNYPAVHIAYVDTVAYCRWLSKKTGVTHRLPTEAEWEFAARGGLDRKPYTWGDKLTPNGKWMANVWQGKFPSENTALDGFVGLAPVGSFPPNGYGLYDMAGNAWEWCHDYYQEDYYALSPAKNPRGPASGIDPLEPALAKRVQRGGSFLCSDQYCIRYQVGARGKGDERSASNNVGFRCVCEAP